MADTLCGPSNPLQNFHKHSSVDRTLQQDRLTARHSPSQGFRSLPGPNAGILDPEFEAFQAGLPTSALDHSLQSPPYQQQHHGQLSSAAQNTFAPPPGPLGWANDFQKLHISPQPAPAYSHHQSALSSPHGSAQWFQDFHTQHYAPEPASQHQSMPQYPMFGGGMSGRVMQQPHGFMPSMTQQPDHSTEVRWKGKGRWRDDEETAQDTAAFEREFEVYASAALKNEGVTAQEPNTSTGIGQDVHIETDHLEAYARAAVMAKGAQDTQDALDRLHDEVVEARRLGEQGTETLAKAQADQRAYLNYVEQQTQRDAEFIREQLEQHSHEPDPMQREAEEVMQKKEEQQHPPQQNDDDLAHTAGELLDRVSDNVTDKFRDSSFLGLMRQLRDHEVRVEGDKMVDVDVENNTQQADLESTAIPLLEQDADLGRADLPRMAGALRSHMHPNETLDTGEHPASWENEYGRHPVDDF